MTNVDIGKLYGVCRRFIDLWENVYSDPKEFEPLVEELREVVGWEQDAAAAALRNLVRLKDGPRDDAYRFFKEPAWQRARDIVRALEGPADD